MTNTVSEYWDKFVGSHLNSPDHWEANKVVEQSQWQYVTGSPHKNPLHWFIESYGPFGVMASICSGSGLLETDVARTYLQGTRNKITGYDISAGSLKVAEERCQGLENVAFQVCDVNTAIWHESYVDAIFAHGALHHVANLDHCLGQLSKALKPTGLLYVNDYVGPRRFQWTDAQLRLAREAFDMVPAQYRRNNTVERCDPVALEELDPSEAVRSDHILDHIRAHFEIKVLSKRGGTLLAPIFGSGCIAPQIFETAEGMQIIQGLCKFERDLIDKEIIGSDQVLVIASPRK